MAALAHQPRPDINNVLGDQEDQSVHLTGNRDGQFRCRPRSRTVRGLSELTEWMRAIIRTILSLILVGTRRVYDQALIHDAWPHRVNQIEEEDAGRDCRVLEAPQRRRLRVRLLGSVVRPL